MYYNRCLVIILGLATVALLGNCSADENDDDMLPSEPSDPPYSGTIFLDPDILTSDDPSAFKNITATGQGDRIVFDRRQNDWININAFLFNATYTDGFMIEVQVNPEFGSVTEALKEAQKYAEVIGQLPSTLRTNVKTATIHKGVNPFGGGNENLLIHTGQSADYINEGILEETLIHEASHTSLDSKFANTPEWITAQEEDKNFISTYARDFPEREDIAESFLLYFALRQRKDRISAQLATTIEQTIPNRILFFDNQQFNWFPQE